MEISICPVVSMWLKFKAGDTGSHSPPEGILHVGHPGLIITQCEIVVRVGRELMKGIIVNVDICFSSTCLLWSRFKAL